MTPPRRGNQAASVRQRLLNLSRERGENFDYLLTRYGLERILYRLAKSPYNDRFILKGAMLFLLWGMDEHRLTRDADLLGFARATRRISFPFSRMYAGSRSRTTVWSLTQRASRPRRFVKRWNTAGYG